jgi:hypothetical protein
VTFRTRANPAVLSRPAGIPHLIFVTGLLLAGCSLTDRPTERKGQWTIEPGALIFYRDTSAVSLGADTVQMGEPLLVRTTTFGNGCVRRARSRVDSESLRAVLTPLDSVYTPAPDEACTEELNEIPHRATVSFERAGTARVVVQGRQEGPDLHDAIDVTFERTVVVVE